VLTRLRFWKVEKLRRHPLKSKGKIIGGEHQGPTRRMLHSEEITRLLVWLRPTCTPAGAIWC